MTTKLEYNMILNENVKLKDTLQATEINNKELQQKIKLLDIELKIVNIEFKNMKKEMLDLGNRIDQLNVLHDILNIIILLNFGQYPNSF